MHMRSSNPSQPRGAIALIACLAGLAAMPGTALAQGDDNLPASLKLDAVIRDFKAHNEPGGHPDFQRYSGSTTIGLVKQYLGEDRVPVVNDLRGLKITSEFKDGQGRNINPILFNPELGDRQGAVTPGSSSNGLTSESDFAKWYKDVPGVNVSASVELTLERVPGTNKYVFDSASHEPYKSIGGFFPINDKLFGNYASTGKNFHFTTEVRTSFIYERDSGQSFKFTGDDDVWVFIDDRLVIDLGGLHSRKEQYLDLDRLDWLQDGRTYTLDIFHAERRTTQSNFRIETTLQLRAVELPPTAALFD